MMEEYQNDLLMFSSANSSSYARKLAASAGKENKTTQNFFQSKPKNGGAAGAAKPFQVGFSFLPSIDGTQRASAWPANDHTAPQRQSALRTPAGHSVKHQIPHAQQQKRDYAIEKRDYVQGAGQRALDAVAGLGASIQPSHSVAAHKAVQQTRWRVKGESSNYKPSQQLYDSSHQANMAYQLDQQRGSKAGGGGVGNLPRRDLVRGQRDRQLDELNETLQRLAREKHEAYGGGRITVHTVKRKTTKANQRNDGFLDRQNVDGYFYGDQVADAKKKKKKSRKNGKGEASSTPHPSKQMENQWNKTAPIDLGEASPESQRQEGMKKAEPTQGVHQSDATAARATPSGSDLRIYKLGRGAVKYHHGSELAQSSIDNQEIRSHPNPKQRSHKVSDIDFSYKQPSNTAQSLVSSSVMREVPEDNPFRGAQEVTSIRISPLEGPLAIAFNITMSEGEQITQKQIGGHEIRSYETSGEDYISITQAEPLVIDREAATSSLLPGGIDPLQGIASDRTPNYTFDNLKKVNKPLNLQLQLTPIQMSSLPTKRLKAEGYYASIQSQKMAEQFQDHLSVDSRSSHNDAEDLARQLPTPRGGAEGAVYPYVLKPGSKSELSRDKSKTIQNETFRSAADRQIMMRNKMASQASNNESFNTQRQYHAPQTSFEPITSDKIVRLDSLGKASSKFSSPTKSNGKPRPGLLTTTIQPNITEQTEVDSGNCSSSAEESINTLKLGTPIKTKREHQSASQEYCQYRGQQLPKQFRGTFTQNKFRKANDDTVYSQRLFLSQECAQSEDRRMLPVLIVNLDGAVGYWDDNQKNFYVLREGIVDSLIQLSHDFRIVAVSSQTQKLIFKLIHGLMNMPSPDSTEQQDFGSLRHLFFDAVYQVNSSTPNIGKIDSLDDIQYDLTQVLVDMQFKRQQISKQEEQIQVEGSTKPGFLTFWESPHYKPHSKVLIFTTEKHLNENKCYSFDYSHLFQAYGFQEGEPRKSPIVLQIPHLRANPKVSFRSVHQLIFALQNITRVICLQKHIQNSNQLPENAVTNSFDVCKKLLSAKWRGQEYKTLHSANIKGLGVFDPNSSPYVNLGMINFSESYKMIKLYFAKKSCNWLRVQKYYLISKPSKKDENQSRKMRAKVTFNDEPHVIQMGDEKDNMKLTFDVSTMNEGSKEEKALEHTRATNYTSEEARDAYNSLVLRNTDAREDINAYTNHFQDKETFKQSQEQPTIRSKLISPNQQEAIENNSALTHPQTFSNLKSCFNRYPKEETEEKPKSLVKQKPYAYKFRALMIKSGKISEEEKRMNLQVVNLNVTDINQASFEKFFDLNTSSKQAAQQELVQMSEANTLGSIEEGNKSFLINLLCKRQRSLPFTTSQDLHLQDNLDLLVGGEDQYSTQEHQLKMKGDFQGVTSLVKGKKDYIDLI